MAIGIFVEGRSQTLVYYCKRSRHSKKDQKNLRTKLFDCEGPYDDYEPASGTKTKTNRKYDVCTPNRLGRDEIKLFLVRKI